MDRQPRTDEEWIVHSLNIHGTFFQRWCERVVAETPGWKHVCSEYPVRYPPDRAGGPESALDIWAERRVDDDVLALLIECKKNNPEFVNWIFFPKSPVTPLGDVRYVRIDLAPLAPASDRWTVRRNAANRGIRAIIANEAREVRGTYQGTKSGNLTKTSNAAINEAAWQVALATQAIFDETFEYLQPVSNYVNPPKPPYARKVFLPTIVTSAKLFTCEFDADDVDTGAGEIALSKATLEPHPWLVYEYPMPRQLHHFPQNIPGDLERHRLVDLYGRMHILVVHSEGFRDMLTTLESEGMPRLMRQ